MPHHIEIFTGNCKLCQEVVDIVTIGKCKSCTMEVLQVDGLAAGTKNKLYAYSITAVPSIVIDRRIKVVGIPNFNWFCSEEFYKFLEKEYPIEKVPSELRTRSDT